ENVIDEEQHILVLLVAEIFGDGEAGKGHAQTGTRRLIHLAVHEGNLGLSQVVLADDPGFGHFAVKIATFPRTLPDTRKYRDAAMQLGDVVNEFHDDDRLAHSGTTEGSHLAALEERTDQVNDFDSGREHLGRSRLLHKRRCRTMNRVVFLRFDGPALIHWFSGHVEYPPHNGFANRHAYRLAVVRNLKTALEAFGTRHGNRSDPLFAEVLLHFERDGKIGRAHV